MALASPGRISQILPSVKCSNCNLPVPLNQLGDHTCSIPPPLPRLQSRLSPAPDTALIERLRVNTVPTGTYQQKSSPLARSAPDPNASPMQQPGPSHHHDSLSRSRPDFRTRSSSNASSQPGPSPSTPRPSFSANRNTPPPPQQPTYHSEAEIDTKSGGEAGMAGVGRRGFAAAARAAMLVAPSAASRRPNAPGLLDIQVPTRATDTPPLSAGSGYSSHSPGVSPFPQSPGPPSPTARYREKAPIIEPPSSPTSVRMPFFEKFRNQLPGVIVPNLNTSPLPNADNNNTTPSTALPPRAETRQSTTSTSSAYSRSYSHRTTSIISSTRSRQDYQLVTRPRSPSSGSEFGLAYADSTDNEEEDHKGDVRKTKANPPPPLPLTSSILRSGSIATTNHVRFPSTSEYSERSAMRIPVPKTGHHRGSSASSASSAGGDDAGSAKTNSEVIAHALGLSRTPPSNYTRLGGPGSTMGGRIARSTSGSSSSGRSAYSLGTSSSIKTGDSNPGVRLERSHSAAVPPTDESEPLRGLSKSKSTSRQNKSFLTESEDDDVKSASAKSVAAPMAHRSNTVQVPVSYSADKPKLVARARTSTQKQTEAVREKKERIRKLRVCVKCDGRIEDGRWIQVDGGAVLCEHCWKNMYLPKCRRCNLPIEKQAVSSKDGQLKGKYHRECFNCFQCSKPFPDKSFYVFDGKPLCAYHYHEANESLCAAARCGQPIEGPCAVSHAGDRYHPEHLTCEYPGQTPCLTRLAEYWEVEGRMLCERHAKASDEEEEGEEGWVQSSKAMKRVTRFIDLAGGGGMSESDSGLR